ncbi:hypothetical protein [Caproicibacter sp. BJN0012]|uniref:hypothetical protein n=1 Tax=Caproicibacter sp. BJN0012 TaxID=3110227 RepID=UPI002E132B08
MGSDIPIQFYTRYERAKGQKDSDSPGPGVYWWHTEDDTYDRVDPEVYRKDTELFFLNVYKLLTDTRLPFAPEEYFNGLIALFDRYKSCGSPYDQDLAFSGSPVFTKLMAFLKTKREEESPAEYVFLRTDFVRQRNRLIAEIRRLNQLLLSRMDNVAH